MRRPPRSTRFPYTPLFRSMHVDVAAEVVDGDELGEPAVRGGLELAASLAQLGRDPRHPQPLVDLLLGRAARRLAGDRKSTRLNSSHANISYAVFCLKKKEK